MQEYFMIFFIFLFIACAQIFAGDFTQNSQDEREPLINKLPVNSSRTTLNSTQLNYGLLTHTNDATVANTQRRVSGREKIFFTTVGVVVGFAAALPVIGLSASLAFLPTMMYCT